MSKFEAKSLTIVLKTLLISLIGIIYYLYKNYYLSIHNIESIENLHPYFVFFISIWIHSFFALLTYILSKIGIPFIYRLRFIICSLIAPALFLCVNIFIIGTYDYPLWVVAPILYFVYKDIKEDIIGTHFKMYLNVLVNPYGKDNEFFLIDTLDRWEIIGDERFGSDEN